MVDYMHIPRLRRGIHYAGGQQTLLGILITGKRRPFSRFAVRTLLRGKLAPSCWKAVAFLCWKSY